MDLDPSNQKHGIAIYWVGGRLKEKFGREDQGHVQLEL